MQSPANVVAVRGDVRGVLALARSIASKNFWLHSVRGNAAVAYLRTRGA